jgi:septal ring factor EnvC (AmiA/AmiB activator)
VLAVVVLAGSPLSAVAADEASRPKLEDVERDLGAARVRETEIGQASDRLARDLGQLKADIAAVTARAQGHESKLAELEEMLERLFVAEAAKSAALAERRMQLAGLLGALERIARHPPIALIALPTNANDTVRSAVLLRDLMPRINAEARALNDTLASLAALRTGIAAEHAHHAESGHALEDERIALADLMREKAAFEQTLGGEARDVRQRIAKLSAQAKDLQGLVDGLVADSAARRTTPSPPAQRPIRPAEPQQASLGTPSTPQHPARPRTGEGRMLHVPVVGRIVEAFGDTTQFGREARGVTVETRSAAPVVAPADGEVAFAGPFRGYGLLLILEVGDGYHVLISGLSRIDAALGTQVRKGDPVGTVDDADGKPALYVEVRRQGRPIDPVPWLAATTSKVSG